MKYILLFILLIQFSCHVDSEPISLIPLGAYYTINEIYEPAIDYYGDGKLIKDVFQTFDDCVKDDTLRFITSNTITEELGELKCNIGESERVLNYKYDTETRLLLWWRPNLGISESDTVYVSNLNNNTLQLTSDEYSIINGKMTKHLVTVNLKKR